PRAAPGGGASRNFFFRGSTLPPRNRHSIAKAFWKSWGGSAGRKRTPMLTQRRILLAASSAIALLLGGPLGARATNVDVVPYPFTGADTSVDIFMDDTGGNIEVTLTVNEGIADLRGFFLNVSDFSLLAGLKVTGDDVTDFKVADDGVINLGKG